MGRQINFYLSTQDEEIFLDFLFRIPNIVFLKQSSYFSPIEIVGGPSQAFIDKSLGLVLIWDQQFQINPKFITKHLEQLYCDDLGGYKQTGRIFYQIDSMYGPLIEYNRSTMKVDNLLTKGRIWADMYYVDAGKFIYKGEGFENLYEKITRWLRNNLLKPRGFDKYIGPEALELFREGKIKLQK
jgi:hypothetical protein